MTFSIFYMIFENGAIQNALHEICAPTILVIGYFTVYIIFMSKFSEM